MVQSELATGLIGSVIILKYNIQNSSTMYGRSKNKIMRFKRVKVS